jgi:beta-lactamase regulating signal transducer with metallopeptidase domain/uncharacterized membrane protein YkoI
MARVSEWVVVFLVNAAWQVAFVTAVAAVADRLLRNAAARYRHFLWVATLLVAVALPLATSFRLATPSSPIVTKAVEPMPSGESEIRSTAAPAAGAQVSTPPARSFQVPTLALAAVTAAAISAIYVLLVLFRVGILALAWRSTRAILSAATEIELPPSIAAALARCRSTLLTGDVRVLAADVAVPVTMGARRPVVILPHELLREADPETVTSAIGHEMAHIARRDYLANLAYELLSLPLWFHPAMVLVRRRIRETREVRCDEIVTERLQDARVYAQSLVELAGAALPFGRAAATITVGIADADILEERVKTLLNRPRLKAQTMLLATAALLFALPCVAAARMALRVNIQPMTETMAPAAIQQTAPAAQPDARQEFIRQHHEGDVVQGKILKKTESRAVIELAPGVTTVVRIPQESKTPYDVGSDHEFKVVDLNPGERIIRLSDPNATFIADGNIQYGVVGGVRTGVAGGVESGVESGVEGPVTYRTMTPNGEVVVLATPKTGYALTQEGDSVMLRKKIEMAEQKEAGEKGMIEMRREPLTAEEKQKMAAMRMKIEAAEQQRLVQTAREAKITIAQAISIAQTQQPGTVYETHLTRERGVATYIVGILSGDDNNPVRTRFLINAGDGKVMEKFELKPFVFNP